MPAALTVLREKTPDQMRVDVRLVEPSVLPAGVGAALTVRPGSPLGGAGVRFSGSEFSESGRVCGQIADAGTPCAPVHLMLVAAPTAARGSGYHFTRPGGGHAGG